jgi:hypothetical protein
MSLSYDIPTNREIAAFLEANPGKINWMYLSQNPAAIDLLKANPDKRLFEDPFAHVADKAEKESLRAEVTRFKFERVQIDADAETRRVWLQKEAATRHESEMKRLIIENAQKRVTAKAEQERLVVEAEQKRLTEKAERKRLIIENAQRILANKRFADETERARVEAETDSTRLAEEEADMKAEVATLYKAEMRKRLVEQRLQQRLAELEPTVPMTVAVGESNSWDKVKQFEAIQTKLHEAYQIPLEQRRNYTALDVAIRGDDIPACKILATRTPLALYHKMRKERNALVHPPVQIPAFPPTGLTVSETGFHTA